MVIAKRLIRKTEDLPRWRREDFQDEDFDIDDKESVRRLTKLWKEKWGNEVPYISGGDDQ